MQKPKTEVELLINFGHFETCAQVIDRKKDTIVFVLVKHGFQNGIMSLVEASFALIILIRFIKQPSKPRCFALYACGNYNTASRGLEELKQIFEKIESLKVITNVSLRTSVFQPSDAMKKVPIFCLDCLFTRSK